MERSCLRIIVGIVLIHISKAALPTGCTGGTPKCPANSNCATDCVCNGGFKLNSTQNGCVAKVLGDVCDPQNGCTGLSNTACTHGKCECATGYAKTNSACSLTTSGTSCTANGNVCGKNSHCVTSKCICNDGFIMHENACIVDTSGKVTDSGCTKGASDQCKHTGNAECDNADTDAKCKCIDGYAEDRTNGRTCVKTVSGTSCTEDGKQCAKIANAQCNTDTCKCIEGFSMNVDVCIADSAAISVQFSSLTFLLSVFVIHQLYW